MRNLIMKAVSGILTGAIVGGLVAAGSVTAAPGLEQPMAAATAEPLASGLMLISGTGECLAADYSNVYTIDCGRVASSGQYWQIINLGGDGSFMLRSALGTCLSNLNWTAVWTTGCSSGDPGLWWATDSASRLWHWHTGRYLVADFAHQVYLNLTAGPEQGWLIG